MTTILPHALQGWMSLDLQSRIAALPGGEYALNELIAKKRNVREAVDSLRYANHHRANDLPPYRPDDELTSQVVAVTAELLQLFPFGMMLRGR